MVRLNPDSYYPDGIPVLFQEQLITQPVEHLPWALAAGAVIMSRTRRHQGFPVIEKILNEWSPLRCINTRDQTWMFRQLVQDLRPSGLMEPKALRLQFLSEDYLSGKPPEHWEHVGEYARDSVLIFTEGKYISYYRDRLPKDGHLLAYVINQRKAIHDASTTTDRLEGHSPENRDPVMADSCGRNHLGGG